MSTDTDLLATLNRIADALELANLLTVEGRPAAPARTLYRPLEAYRAFDWGSIHTDVLESDEWGAVVVEWNGRQFKRRRSPADDSKGEAIWFSRPWSGTVEGKDLVYEKLIVFRDAKPGTAPKPIKGELAERLRAAAPAPASAPAVGAPPHTAPSQPSAPPRSAPSQPARAPRAPSQPTAEAPSQPDTPPRNAPVLPAGVNHEGQVRAALDAARRAGASQTQMVEMLVCALSASNGATLFYAAVKFWFMSNAQVEQAKTLATTASGMDWAKALRHLGAVVEPF